tara:strand:+ start:2336 stop:2764 length:429 start_codon:yes stop_codon:yes gene_type:complete
MTNGVDLVPEYQRVSRVSEAMKEEIADILRKKLKDPRVGFATITDITVTRDFRHAWVKITVFEGETTEEETLLGLAKAAGFIRSELGRRLRLRRIPDLTFQSDRQMAKTQEVLTLLDSLNTPEKTTDSSIPHKHQDKNTSSS